MPLLLNDWVGSFLNFIFAIMTFIFTQPQISIAAIQDLTELKNLLNSAYRGESSLQGWTTEAHIISGDVRTDEGNMMEVMQTSGSVFLKYTDDIGQIIGCVNLQLQHKKLYLGMFSVSPTKQGAGIGRQILLAAEEYARYCNCDSIYMSVISIRAELIDWYKRNGYAETGERKFFEEDGLTGKHLQPLEFLMLSKQILSV
jgi:ribosomal protein S18 acetylase RimI-like enzyme